MSQSDLGMGTPQGDWGGTTGEPLEGTCRGPGQFTQGLEGDKDISQRGSAVGERDSI